MFTPAPSGLLCIDRLLFDVVLSTNTQIAFVPVFILRTLGGAPSRGINDCAHIPIMILVNVRVDIVSMCYGRVSLFPGVDPGVCGKQPTRLE